MKVRSLYIKDHQQFKDFSLDLTYPKGHAKAGQPLDKVCIIGQSGTGKTTLLRFLQNFTSINVFNNVFSIDESISLDEKSINRFIQHEITFISESKIDIDFGVKNQKAITFNSFIESRATINESQLINNEIYYYLESIPTKNIFIPADIIHKYKEIDDNQEQTLKELRKDFVDITDVSLVSLWNEFIKDITIFQEEEIRRRLEISEIVQTAKPEAISNAVKELQRWLDETPNPIKELAEKCLDKILNKFKLQVRQKLDFKRKEDIGFIKIETLQGQEVPNGLLSTGTKQVILTALPLYTLKPERAIILFDEPERSLYPDIQTEIVDFYTSLVEDCQFFFATHSPLIAASFEPWEIVELKFNEEGNVYREKYYKDENHIDNYTTDPRYLKWDSILTRIFGLDNDAPETRTEKLMELATLKSKIKKANGSLPPQEKAKLQIKFNKIAELLDWEYDAEN